MKEMEKNLAFDLMNNVIRMFNVRYKGARNLTRIGIYSKGIIVNAHNSYDGEENGVKHTGRRPKTKPLINENKHRWKVNEGNGSYDDGDVEREHAATFHFPTEEDYRRREFNGGVDLDGVGAGVGGGAVWSWGL